MRVTFTAALAVILAAAGSGLAEDKFDGAWFPKFGTVKAKPDFLYWRSESLSWWIQSAPVPALITVAPATANPDTAGVIGAPGTSVIFGGERENGESRYGIRYTGGAWLVPGLLAVEGNFLMLESQSHGLGLTSNGSPIIARPFFDAVQGVRSASPVALPGQLIGGVHADASSDNLIGAGGLIRAGLGKGGTRFDLLGGYRFLRFDEGLSVTETITTQPGFFFFPPGTNFVGRDSFVTHNIFHGADLGLEASIQGGPFTFGLLAKCGVGNTRRVVKIDGSTTATLPGARPVTEPGALLTQRSNIGVYTDDQFTLLPEFGARVGWRVVPGFELTLGYTFIYWPEVVRPGDQVDPNINLTQTGSPLAPTFPGKDSSMWIQGATFGMTFRF